MALPMRRAAAATSTGTARAARQIEAVLKCEPEGGAGQRRRNVHCVAEVEAERAARGVPRSR